MSDPKDKQRRVVNRIFILVFLASLIWLLFFSTAKIPDRFDETLGFNYEMCFDTSASYVPEKQIALLAVKRWESLELDSYYDVNAFRNGWGTRSSYDLERISLEEADRRCEEHFDKVLQGIQSRYPDLTSWQQLVLTVMDYNVSRFGPGLNRAIRSGDSRAISEKMKLYINITNPDGTKEPLDGLVLRRAAESELLLAQPHERQEIYSSLVAEVDRHILNAV